MADQLEILVSPGADPNGIYSPPTWETIEANTIHASGNVLIFSRVKQTPGMMAGPGGIVHQGMQVESSIVLVAEVFAGGLIKLVRRVEDRPVRVSFGGDLE